MRNFKFLSILFVLIVTLSAVVTTLDVIEPYFFNNIVQFNPPEGEQQITFNLAETGGTGPKSGAIHIDNSQNTGHALTIYSDQDSSVEGALLRITTDNKNFDKPTIWLINKGDSGSASGIRIDSPRPEIEFYESDETPPRGIFELRINDNRFEIGTRKASNDGFEYPFTFLRGADGGYFGIKTKPKRNIHINDTMRLEPRSNPPQSPSLGDIYTDKESKELCFYNGSNWIGLVNRGECR